MLAITHTTAALRNRDDELNRPAIFKRLTEIRARSGVAKICHRCQASSLGVSWITQ